ncbi:DoxX family protein [Agrobacterium sp. rho-13.3]|uniref:DoxX family protein n=1 Tax=Agrobacterium sp. rho-13.3 TaxID=3072980 RepID=UPI002A17DD1B|nr:DoxX family protein [Agrobacterium sp. rho-13.3]MDX8309640.1 DoxX family protein [Agrobacterium sp. rho-13.3]
MSYVAISTPLPRWQTLTGSVMSGLVIAFLIFDGAIKLVPIAPVTETMVALGYSGDPSLARGLGIMTLLIALLYAIPRTSVLGAILLTGLLGGAIATHLRVGSPLFTHMFFGVYLGLLAWGGLYLRSDLLRMLIPFRPSH